MLGHPARVARNLGSAIHGQRPDEVFHFDFCFVFRFIILIIQDDLSGFVHLNICENADSKHVATYLLQWISEFGVPKCLVSEKVSHFNNQAVKQLQESLLIRHHITLPYSPLSNGSIERIVRDFKEVLKKLRTEVRIQQ